MVSLVCGLILPRYILLAYGSEYNGLLASVTQFMGVTEILTMGLAGAARVELYDSLAHNDIRRTSGVIKSVNQYMYKAAAAFLLYMGAMLVLYPMIAEGSFTFAEIASLILIIGTGNIIVYVFGYAYNVLLDADNSVYLYTTLRIVLLILNVVVSVSLIKNGFSIQCMKLSSGLILAIGPLVLCCVVPKIYKLDRKAPVDISWRKNRKYAAAHSISLIIHDNTDVVLLTVLTSTKVVSVYSVYALVVRGLKSILSVFTSSMEPFLGNLWAKKEMETIKKTLTNYEFFIGFFTSISLSCALGLILPFVALYTKGIHDIEYVQPVFAFVTIMAELARCLRIPYLTLVQAAGRYKQTQASAFIEAGMNIVISITLTFRFGLVGVMVGTLCANLFRTLYYSWYISHHMLVRPLKRTFGLMLWTVCNMLLNVGIYHLLSNALGLSITSWGSWVVGAILIAAISITEVLIASRIFYREHLGWIYGFLGKFIKKLKK